MRVRPNIATNWILHHDNAPAHAAFSLAQFLTSKGIYGDAAASLLTWSRALRLLFIPKNKIGSERIPFWVNRRHPEVCNAGFKRHSSSCVPGMLQTMAAPLENVCAGTRDVFWRWPYFSWWINKIKLFFGTSLITLLSDLVLSRFNGRKPVLGVSSSCINKYLYMSHASITKWKLWSNSTTPTSTPTPRNHQNTPEADL